MSKKRKQGKPDIVYIPVDMKAWAEECIRRDMRLLSDKWRDELKTNPDAKPPCIMASDYW